MHSYRLLGAPGGGGGKRGTPSPDEPAVDPPLLPNKSLAVFWLALARPGIEIEKVCPSFKE